jgi:hypothetical protein
VRPADRSGGGELTLSFYLKERENVARSELRPSGSGCPFYLKEQDNAAPSEPRS